MDSRMIAVAVLFLVGMAAIAAAGYFAAELKLRPKPPPKLQPTILPVHENVESFEGWLRSIGERRGTVYAPRSKP